MHVTWVLREAVVNEGEILSERNMTLEVTCKYYSLDFQGKEADCKS